MIWVLIFILISAFLTLASFKICLRVYVKSVCKIKEGVALTFDDGPHPIHTPQLLDTLRDLNIKASFFVIGHRAEQYPEILKRIVNEGHSIGIHSYAHNVKFDFMSSSQVQQDLQKTQQIIEQATNYKTDLFRPPFGVTNPNIASAVRKMELKTIGWSLRTFDTTQSAEKVTRKVSKNLKNGDIILMHDHLEQTVETVKAVSEIAQKKGLKFMKLKNML